MTQARATTISLVGAGPVGCLAGILLAKRGYRVDVYERRSDPKSGRIDGGRSINLALSDRGLVALERAGIREEVETVAIPMRGRTMHSVDGKLAYQPYGKGDQAIRSVSRGGLNLRLIELLRAQPNVTMHFSHRCEKADIKTNQLTFDVDGQKKVVQAERIIASDGAFSEARYAMQRTDRFQYRQDYLEHGYKELTIPGGPDGAFLLEKNALHIWPREDYMLIALPNPDGSFTCTLFFRLEGQAASFATLNAVSDARRFFEEKFADALKLMPTFDEDWQRNPVSTLCTVRAFPWSVKGKCLLIGDAAHAIVPFFGQGMNAGFEDCRVLIDVLDETKTDEGDDWFKAMEKFERVRKPSADAIAELALENFVEMRDKTGQPAFLLRKKIEAYVGELCKDKFTPLYTMVTFSPNLPYAEALSRGKKQDLVLDRITAISGIESTFHTGAHDVIIRQIVDEIIG